MIYLPIAKYLIYLDANYFYSEYMAHVSYIHKYHLNLTMYISQKLHTISRFVSKYKPNLDAFTVKRWPEYTIGGSVVRKLCTDRRTGNFLFVHWITMKTYPEMLYAKWKMFMFYYIFIQKKILFLEKAKNFLFFLFFFL